MSFAREQGSDNYDVLQPIRRTLTHCHSQVGRRVDLHGAEFPNCPANKLLIADRRKVLTAMVVQMGS